MVARKLSPIAGFSPILLVPYLLIVTLVIQVLSPILRVSPILRAPIASVYCIRGLWTDTMAEAWRGGIGEYPPNPERFSNTPRCPEAKPTDEGGIAKPRRMRRVFSNTSEPCLGHWHCYSEKNKYFYTLSEKNFLLLSQWGDIDQCHLGCFTP